MPSTNGHGSKPEQVALYLRVSSEEQRDAGTIETQREFLLHHAERSGFEVAETYADDGISGTVPLHKRPEGARLLEDAGEGKFQTVLVYKLDRLGRTQLGILNAADRLEGMSIALRSATEHFETVSPQGRLMFQMLGSFAEFERASIRERTRDGLHRAWRNGRQTGTIPYGYTIAGDGSLALVPEQAQVVRQIFENIAAGATLYSEVKRLNTLGIPPPGWRYRRKKHLPGTCWKEPTVHDILHRRAYSGVHEVKVDGGRGRIEREVPAVVSPELQECALRTLKQNKRYSGGKPKRNYILSGLITCAVCGCSCSGQSSMSKGKRYSYYRCTDDHPSRGLRAPRGHSPNVPAPWLEATVWEDVRHFLREPGDVLERMRRQHAGADDAGELEARVEDLSTRLAAKHKERDNYIRLCARGSISEPELDSYLAGLGIEAESIQLLLEDARSELAAKEHDRLAAQSAEEWLLALRDRVEEVEEDTPEAYQKRSQLVKLLVSGVTAGWDADGRLDVRITYRFGPPEGSDRGDVFAIGINDTP
jgi:site-specific DNA recombinase